MSDWTLPFGTCDKLSNAFWNSICEYLFPETVQEISLNFSFSINRYFFIFGPIKRSSTCGIKMGLSTEIWRKLGYQDWLFQVELPPLRSELGPSDFSSTLFQSGWKMEEHTFLWYFHEPWNASIPLLNGFSFLEIQWETRDTKRSMSVAPLLLQSAWKICGFSFHLLESFIDRDWKSASWFNTPCSYSTIIVISFSK